MRSRYAAYTRADIDYVERTTAPEARGDFDRDGSLAWAKQSEWLGLEIVSTRDGGADDKTGVVEFIARYKVNGHETTHHEISEFRRDGKQWYFVDGKLVRDPVVNVEPRVGRNDPCPCGSGKKYKKCCGTAA